MKLKSLFISLASVAIINLFTPNTSLALGGGCTAEYDAMTAADVTYNNLLESIRRATEDNSQLTGTYEILAVNAYQDSMDAKAVWVHCMGNQSEKFNGPN